MTKSRAGSPNAGRRDGQSVLVRSSVPVWLAMLLGLAAGGVLWIGLIPGVHLPPLGTGVVFALAGFWGLVWLGRVRATRRLRAAMDAYAQREIDQAREWEKSTKTLSGRKFHARSQSQAR